MIKIFQLSSAELQVWIMLILYAPECTQTHFLAAGKEFPHPNEKNVLECTRVHVAPVLVNGC